jgi:hypothetical protein
MTDAVVLDKGRMIEGLGASVHLIGGRERRHYGTFSSTQCAGAIGGCCVKGKNAQPVGPGEATSNLAAEVTRYATGSPSRHNRHGEPALNWAQRCYGIAGIRLLASRV